MPALVPQGTPSWQHGGGGASTPVWPAGYTPTVGDRAYIYTDVYEGNATFSIPPGWVTPPAAANAPTSCMALVYKDVAAGDTLPACVWTNGFQTSSICVVTRGNHAPIASCVEIGALRQSSSTNIIPFPALAVSNPNDWLLAMGFRYKTATGNAETVGALPSFAPLTAASVPSGTSIVSSINAWQQTTATSLALDGQACSLADSNQTCRGWIVAFKTLATASAGFTSQPTVSAATAIPNGRFTLSFTPSGGAGTFYAVAVVPGSTVPTPTQIEAGQDANGDTALASVSASSTGIATSAQLGGSLINAVYDIHCVYRTTVDSAVVTLRSQFLGATSGFEFAVVSGSPAPGTISILTGATPAAVAGDIIESSQFTSPGNFQLAITGTGVPQFPGDSTRQSFQYRVFQLSTATWSALVTGYINDSPPAFQPPTAPIVCALNAVITPAPLDGLWSSANGDPITVAAVSGLPPGLFISGNKLVGAGTVQGIYTLAMTGSDLAGTTTPGSVVIIVGNVQVPAPLKGQTQLAAQSLILTAFLTPQSVLVPSTAPAGQVTDVSPAEGTFVAPFTNIVLSVATPLPDSGGGGGGGGVVGGGGTPIQDPGSIVPRLSSVDLKISDVSQFWGNDLSLSNTQDLALVSGTVQGQQRILRRLLTNPGDYLFQPNYGAGLPAYIGQTADVAKITALITSQILLEDTVAQVPAPVVTVTSAVGSADASALAISIQYTDAPTGSPQVLSFSLSK